MDLFSTNIDTPIGEMLAIANANGVLLLLFRDDEKLEWETAKIRQHSQMEISTQENPVLCSLVSELEEYFSGKRERFSVKVSPRGTNFQQRAWQALSEIPFGKAVSYRRQAEMMGSASAIRAAAAANAANRICILIPCHRVLTSSGKIGGYRGGVWRKKWLINFEQNRIISSPAHLQKFAF